MLHHQSFITKATLLLTSTTKLKPKENIQFTVIPGTDKDGKDIFRLTDVVGDFDITNIKTSPNKFANSDCDIDVTYDEKNQTFYPSSFSNGIYSFTITFKTPMKEVDVVLHELKISPTQIQNLDACEFFKKKFVLPGYNDLKFTYYVKKVYAIRNGNTSEKNVEILIENPYNIKIQGKEGDFVYKDNEFEKFNLKLKFTIDSSINILEMNTTETADKNSTKSVSNNQKDKITESHSIVSSSDNKNFNHPNPIKFYEILSNNRYADVFFIPSCKTTVIPSHRCILSKMSNVFENIFYESTEFPVTINVEEFDAETIQAALEYLYGKSDSINGKEMNVLKFAIQFDIFELLKACCSYLMQSVDSSNVCEYIDFAYFYGFEELKKKCLKILVEKKKEINPSKLADLPKYILSDFFSL